MQPYSDGCTLGDKNKQIDNDFLLRIETCRMPQCMTVSSFKAPQRRRRQASDWDSIGTVIQQKRSKKTSCLQPVHVFPSQDSEIKQQPFATGFAMGASFRTHEGVLFSDQCGPCDLRLLPSFPLFAAGFESPMSFPIVRMLLVSSCLFFRLNRRIYLASHGILWSGVPPITTPHVSGGYHCMRFAGLSADLYRFMVFKYML